MQLTVSLINGVTVVVTTTADRGVGSLREALYKINATQNQDDYNRIMFAIPTHDSGYQASTSSWLITPLSTLPTLTRRVEIDGFHNVVGAFANTNPCDHANTAELKIELRGPGKVDNQDFPLHGLVFGLGSDGSTIKGLCINNFANTGGCGILLQSNSNTIQGCFIGSDITGMISMPNGSAICSEGNDNRIGGSVTSSRNLISGSYGETGVIAKPIGTLSIVGNTIGLNKQGTDILDDQSAIGINFGGGHFSSSSVTDNVIAGHTQTNLSINIFPYVAAMTVFGNKIGTDVTGMQHFDIQGTGIEIMTAPSILTELSNFLPIHIEENVISGNTCGIVVKSTVPAQSRGTDVEIVRNIIGLNAQETNSLPNTLDGIVLNGSYGTIVHNNRISGNNGNGIRADRSKGLLIQANHVGLNSTGQSFANGRNGIQLGMQNTIKQTIQDVVIFDNKICFNKEQGVFILPSVKEVIMHRNTLENNGLNGLYLTPGSHENLGSKYETEGDFWFTEGAGTTVAKSDTRTAPLQQVNKTNASSAGAGLSNKKVTEFVKNVVTKSMSGDQIASSLKDSEETINRRRRLLMRGGK